VGFHPQADAGHKFDVEEEEEEEEESRSFLSKNKDDFFIFSSLPKQISMLALSTNAHNSNCDDGLESN